MEDQTSPRHAEPFEIRSSEGGARLLLRRYRSDLHISATSDRLGHVALEVCLEKDAPFGWRVHGKISLDAGQLDLIAAAARTFCARTGA